MKMEHKGFGKPRRVCDRCFLNLTELEKIAMGGNYLRSHRTLLNSYKIVFLGPCGAGKTSFVQKSVRGYAPPEDELYGRLGVSMLPFDVLLESPDLLVPFHIWDISGSQRYFGMLEAYCSDLDVCILAFNVTEGLAMEDLRSPWINLIRAFDRTETVVGLLGLQNDGIRAISFEEATLFAKTQAMDFYLEANSLSSQTELQELYRCVAQKAVARQCK